MKKKDVMIPMNKWDINQKEAFFVSYDLPSLFNADIVNQEIKVEKSMFFASENNWSVCIQDGEYVFLFEDWGNLILKYNINTHETKYKRIDHEKTLGIFDVYIKCKKIYAVSIRRGIIYILDIDNLDIYDEIKILDSNLFPQNFCHTRLKKDKIYIPTGNAGSIIVYDMIRNTIDTIDVKAVCESVYTLDIYRDDELLIAGSKKGSIYHVKILGEKIQLIREYYIYENTQNDEQFPLFDEFIIKNNKLYAFQNFNDEISCIDLLKQTIDIIIPDPNNRTYRPTKLYLKRYIHLYSNDNRIGIFDNVHYLIYELDFNENTVINVEYSLSKEELNKVFAVKEILSESKCYRLYDFCNFILNTNKLC